MVSNDAASSKKALLMGCDFNVKSGTTEMCEREFVRYLIRSDAAVMISM